MALRERIITDVEEACALREAGLLWRCTGFGQNERYVPGGSPYQGRWPPDEIRKWIGWTMPELRSSGYFFVLLED